MSSSRIIVCSAADFASHAARTIAEVIGTAVARHGRCSLALAGGATPEPVYRQLARPPRATPLPWWNVSIYFGDERAVPADDPASNFRMAREALLEHVTVAPDHIHRMAAERADRDAAAAEYALLLPEHLDLLLLGLGGDGHTASLFPHSPALQEATRRVVPVTGPTPPAHRLTVTPPVLAAAHHAIVLVTGADKAAIVARVLEGPERPEELPAQLVRGATWILDDAAAALLQR